MLIKGGRFLYFHHFHKVVYSLTKTIVFAKRFEREILRHKELCTQMDNAVENPAVLKTVRQRILLLTGWTLMRGWALNEINTVVGSHWKVPLVFSDFYLTLSSK